MPAPQAEQRLGDYRLQRVLGEGSSAVVYLAQDVRDGGWVALKVMSAQGMDAPVQSEPRERFLQQARIARTLRHPGIVSVHAAGEAEGRLWLAMEAVPGCSLERYTRGRRLLPVPLVAHVGRRVAQALAHAHGLGVVHRDLKPANVMVDWPSDTIKLTDLGLARSADATPSATGLLLGTPAYMAPEQLAGNTPTPATDLYALGVMLYELIAGRLPYEATRLGQLLREVAFQQPPDLLSLQPGTPPALATLVARLMAKQPGQRPPSAAAVADALAPLDGSRQAAA